VRRVKRGAYLAGVLLVSLAAHLAAARAWGRLGVFEQHDVLFDADPVVVLGMLRDGEMKDRLWRTHPNLRNLGHPPVRLLAAAARLARPSLPDSRARDAAALALPPLAASAASGAAFLTFEALGATPSAAALVALLQAFSFSSLVFGSLPESYPLSGAVLATAWLMAARDLRAGRSHKPSWAALASLAVGLTTTNLALAVTPLLFVEARRRSWPAALRTTGFVAAGALLFAFLQLQLFNAAYGDDVPWRRAVRRPEPYLGARPLATARELPQALALTLLAAPPARVATEIAEQRDYPYKEMFTSRATEEPAVSRWLRAVVVAGVLAVGARRLGQGAAAPLVPAALATLALNATLHTVFRGSDLFLYSQHWLSAMVLLAGGLALGPRWERRALLAFTAIVAASSTATSVGMIERLAAIQR
jgi:hypothetical protein